MFERIVSNIIITRSYAVFEDVMENNWLNLGVRIRSDGEEIINCIIKEKEVGGEGKVGKNSNAYDLNKSYTKW